ncbi:hypothetical protein DOY81_011443 [Sarcophaga bullata]|nr:hypothetical protein DOY81_011443 [Sarcophaga bullata]
MSKFNYSTSTEDEISNGPLIFSQLEALTNWLFNESMALQEEFNNKSLFVNENFIKINRNETELVKISNFIQMLRNAITIVEKELQEIESDLNNINNCVYHVESLSVKEPYYSKRNCKCGECIQCRSQSSHGHIALMKILEDTESKLLQLPTLMENMELLQSYCVETKPYEQIFSILNYHYESLKNTEKNLDILVDKLADVSLQQTEIAKQRMRQ